MKKLLTLLMMLMTICGAIAISGCGSGDKFEGKWVAVCHKNDSMLGEGSKWTLGENPSFRMPIYMDVVEISKSGDSYDIAESKIKKYKCDKDKGVIRKNEAEHLKTINAIDYQYADNNRHSNNEVAKAALEIVYLHCDLIYNWEDVAIIMTKKTKASVQGNGLKLENGSVWTYNEENKTFKRGNVTYCKYSGSEEKRIKEEMQNVYRAQIAKFNENQKRKLENYKAKAKTLIGRRGNNALLRSTVEVEGYNFRTDKFIDNINFKD